MPHSCTSAADRASGQNALIASPPTQQIAPMSRQLNGTACTTLGATIGQELIGLDGLAVVGANQVGGDSDAQSAATARRLQRQHHRRHRPERARLHARTTAATPAATTPSPTGKTCWRWCTAARTTQRAGTADLQSPQPRAHQLQQHRAPRPRRQLGQLVLRRARVLNRAAPEPAPSCATPSGATTSRARRTPSSRSSVSSPFPPNTTGGRRQPDVPAQAGRRRDGEPVLQRGRRQDEQG